MSVTPSENVSNDLQSCFSEKVDSVSEVFVVQYQPYIEISIIRVIFQNQQKGKKSTQGPNASDKIMKQTVITAPSFHVSILDGYQPEFLDGK